MPVACLAILLSLATPPSPTAPIEGAARAQAALTLPEGAARSRYALRVLGSKIGEPEITFDPVKHLGDGRRVRTLRFESGISERLQRLYPARTAFVGVLDAKSYRPLRSRYELRAAERHRVLDIDFKGARLEATVVENGTTEEVVDDYEPGMIDTVSSVGWLAARGLRPGEVAEAPHHSTLHRYRFWAKAEALEEVRVPAGTFRSVRIECRLYPWREGETAQQSVEAGRDWESRWTLWLTDDEWRSPVRLLAHVGVLGDFELELIGRRLD